MTDLSSGTAPADVSLTRLARPEPMRVQVQAAVRELIIRRIFVSGQHIVEAEVASRLNVSRQPVREALQALHQEGWLDLHVGRGAFVHTPTDREVNEVFAVRGVLEEEAARLATPLATGEDIERLRSICRRGRAALASGDDDATVATNAEFHRSITNLSSNGVLADILASLDQRIRWYFTPLVRSRGADSWDEHDRIIEAIQDADAAEAAARMRQHTENTRGAYNGAPHLDLT